MKKRNLFKRIASVTLAATMFLSLMTVTANADNVGLRKPVRGDLKLGSDTYVTTNKDANGVITGRTIDAAKASNTTLAGTTEGTFQIRPINVATDGVYTFGGTNAQLKTSFSWQFDFSLEGTIPATTDKCRILLGSNWKNKLYFVALDDTHYYIQWSSTPDAYVNEVNKSTLESAYVLEEGKTYRMKIEVNFDTDKAYVTFINPYLDSSGNKKENPDFANAYTRTTISKNTTLGFTLASSSNVKNTDSAYRFPLKIQDLNKGIKLTMSNETFYMDRLYALAPTISVSGNSVTASAEAINIPDYGYYGYLPSLLCAVYKNDSLVDFAESTPYVSALKKLTSSEYSATIENLEDGTYTLKAFIWNSVGEMQPYGKCLVEKTLTVTDGVAVITE